ncbi:MAG: gamma-glutamyltransferase family protein [Sandaracinaceae bacterium]
MDADARERRAPTDADAADLSERHVVHPQRVGFSPDGMVATAHYEATRAGVRMLAQGGNAVDAAVAAAFALGVCEPAASGLGGQTMMLVHRARTRRTVALDGSSRAPNRAVPGLVTGEALLRGYRATTVPSTVATLGYALGKYGTKPLSEVLAPAIELAEGGYAVSALQRRLMKRVSRAWKGTPTGAVFLRQGERLPRAGERLVQPALAATLRRLAAAGTDDFYVGEIARAIDADMQRQDGLLRADDLARIPMPIERRPVTCEFEGRRVMTMPPPGAGRTLIEMLNILKHLPKRRRIPDEPASAVLLAEVIRRAFLDRNDRPFDPNLYPQVGARKMVSEDYARKVAREVRARVEAGRGETTHLSVMDREGNVVGLTQSIERVFGARVATPELGFLYNDYMSAFELTDISHPYYLRPNAVPWASVAPTIVFQGKDPWLVIGSPGSERIVSSIVQVLLRLGQQSPYDAVAAPRIHCSLTGKVSLEASRMRSDIPAALSARGFTIDPREPFAFYLGCVQLVLRDGGGFIGVADPRRDGSAEGPAMNGGAA